MKIKLKTKTILNNGNKRIQKLYCLNFNEKIIISIAQDNSVKM